MVIIQFIISRVMEIKAVVITKLIFFSLSAAIFSIQVVLGKVLHAVVCLLLIHKM